MNNNVSKNKLTPFSGIQPPEALPEIVVTNAVPEDERVWVPIDDQVWFRPLCLSASSGYWMNVLRVRKSGVRLEADVDPYQMMV